MTDLNVQDDITHNWDLFENAHDPVQSVAPDGSLLYANRAWREALGYGEDEIPSLSIFDVVHPDSTDRYASALQQVLAGESVEGIEIVFVTRDHRAILLEGNINCRLEDGAPVGTCGIFRDTTSRKRIEEALRASEEKMRALLEYASEGIVIVSSSGAIELVNARIEQMFGYDRKELLGRTVEVLLPLRFWEVHAKHCASYLREPHVRLMGAGLDLVGRRKDGTEFPVDVSLSFVELKGEILALSFVTDITERKRAEEALRGYSERLEEMVEERTVALREAQAQILSQQRLRQDLELAEQVQASLLPRQVPSLDGFEFAAMALPARYVGGDLYDFILPEPQICHIVLADIAGKGVPAALLTSTARALLRAETEHESAPERILANLNTSLYEDLVHAEVFITVFAACLDAQLGALTYASAGHTETLWWQVGQQACRPLPGTGLPLGIFADASIGSESLLLRPGDVLVFYSDGVTEAASPDDELFGLERLVAQVGQHSKDSAGDLAQAIVGAVDAFRAGAPLSDDLTLVILKALPRTLSFAYPATLEYLNEVTDLVRQVALAYGFDFAYQVELAASELATNVIRHAYGGTPGEMRGQITLSSDRVQLDLYDDGASFDPADLPELDPDQPREGGYGLSIVRQLADTVSYTPGTPGGNRWRLVKLAAEK